MKLKKNIFTKEGIEQQDKGDPPTPYKMLNAHTLKIKDHVKIV
jgi:hypothetical protein